MNWKKIVLGKEGLRMSVKKWLTGLVVLLAMIVVVTTPGSLSVFAESGVVTQPIESVKAIEVELNDDYFNPKVITIPNGSMTTLILKNKGTKKHTFTVEKLRIDAEIQPGKEKTITGKPKKAGTYDLICRYHLQEGMAGKVIVK
jgi:plastocyanin